MPSLDDQDDAAGAAKLTSLLNEAAVGSSFASAELLPLVYERLRALAGRKMRQERPDQTLQATALVHEAYLRLVDTTKPQAWESRWQFFAAAAESMRRILVDNARSRNPWFAALGGSLSVGYRVGRVTPRAGAELLGSPDRPRFGVLQEGVGIEAFTPKAWQIAGFVGLAYLL